MKNDQTITVKVGTPIAESFRVAQVAGMFDVPLSERQELEFSVTLPRIEDSWQIGLIVGPSGSGKSTIARAAFNTAAFGDAIYRPGIDWPEDASVLDGFPAGCDARQVTSMLTSVGFSSPPAWVRPYAVLSNGEKFRCDLARALISHRGTEAQRQERVVVFDEFTSVVDRTVAKIGSAAVAKAIRNLNSPSAGSAPLCENIRFVAVTCHYDVAQWLCPDWILDTTGARVTGNTVGKAKLTRRRLRRPQLQLEIWRAGRAAWDLFKQHHYLSQSIPGGASIYVGMLSGIESEAVPVACCVVANHFGNHRPGVKGIRRISRTVVLPDYQGIGIGGKFVDSIAAMITAEGYRVVTSTSHPGRIAHLNKSQHWRVTSVSPYGRDARLLRRAVATGLWKAGAIPSTLGRVQVAAVFFG